MNQLRVPLFVSSLREFDTALPPGLEHYLAGNCGFWVNHASKRFATGLY
jgi:hypothetical protein